MEVIKSLLQTVLDELKAFIKRHSGKSVSIARIVSFDGQFPEDRAKEILNISDEDFNCLFGNGTETVTELIVDGIKLPLISTFPAKDIGAESYEYKAIYGSPEYRVVVYRIVVSWSTTVFYKVEFRSEHMEFSVPGIWGSDDFYQTGTLSEMATLMNISVAEFVDVCRGRVKAIGTDFSGTYKAILPLAIYQNSEYGEAPMSIFGYDGTKTGAGWNAAVYLRFNCDNYYNYEGVPVEDEDTYASISYNVVDES